MMTVIKGGTVVTASDTFDADVLIDGEYIASVGKVYLVKQRSTRVAPT